MAEKNGQRDRFVASPLLEQMQRLAEYLPNFKPDGVDEAAANFAPGAEKASASITELVIIPTIAQLGDVYGRKAPGKDTYVRAFQHVNRLLHTHHPAFKSDAPPAGYFMGWDLGRCMRREFPMLQANYSYMDAETIGKDACVFTVSIPPNTSSRAFGPNATAQLYSQRGVRESVQAKKSLSHRTGGEFDLDPVALMVLMLTHPHWLPVGDENHAPWITCLGALAYDEQSNRYYPTFKFLSEQDRVLARVTPEIVLSEQHGNVALRSAIAKGYVWRKAEKW